MPSHLGPVIWSWPARTRKESEQALGIRRYAAVKAALRKYRSVKPSGYTAHDYEASTAVWRTTRSGDVSVSRQFQNAELLVHETAIALFDGVFGPLKPGRSRSRREGESSSYLCDRLSRTRVPSQRQLPTNQDYAVSTREYQTDQSSLKSAPTAAGPVLEQQQKPPHRFALLT